MAFLIEVALFVFHNDCSKGWKGWLEDRRPASNGDPYKIAARIIKTVNSALVYSTVKLNFVFHKVPS
jgi:hypothetical protein